MRKAVAVVLALATLGAMSHPSQQPTITISPIPPQQGQTMAVSYTGGNLPVTLNVEWVPAGSGPATITIPKSGSLRVAVPSNAVGVGITDSTPNGADAQATVIVP